MANLYSAHMTMQDSMRDIDQTHLGQAHIAGTGPQGKTCRECIKWGIQRGRSDRVEHLSEGDGNGYMVLNNHKCNHLIANKSDACFPHDAPACMFFDENPSPPEAKRVKLRLSAVEKARLKSDG